MKRVAVLGSTGSIGRSTLEVIASHPDRFQLVGIAARAQIEELALQTQRWAPTFVAVWDAERAKQFAHQTGRHDVLVGVDGLIELATHPDVDVVVVATSGSGGLLPLIRAIQAGKRIALASKELLVMAGELIMRLVQEHGVSLVPIDSEHAALFQCLQGRSTAEVERLIITGSGGPLLDVPSSRHHVVSKAQVLTHPKWQMGPKITVDSATLMNKGLEVIEARWLFGVPSERIHVLLHPEALVHGLIEWTDGTWLAQLSPCDMRLPIQYALSFPERWRPVFTRLSMPQLGSLRFLAPDLEQFPCLGLALEAIALEGGACAVLNGANDVAVHRYLEDQLPFTDIPRVIRETLEQHTPVAHPTLDEILALDAWARHTADEVMGQWSLR